MGLSSLTWVCLILHEAVFEFIMIIVFIEILSLHLFVGLLCGIVSLSKIIVSGKFESDVAAVKAIAIVAIAAAKINLVIVQIDLDVVILEDVEVFVLGQSL